MADIPSTGAKVQTRTTNLANDQSAGMGAATPKGPYKMSLSLNVLNHLGIGLYSNVPAVISEIVANAWDADATEVTIEIYPKEKKIVITDNGVGMKRTDINKKFLLVGYKKRLSEPDGGRTGRGRSPMGRKGIGKLSVFSVADTVEVYSSRDGEISAFRMTRQAIEAQIDSEELAERDYYPEPLEVTDLTMATGTKIILTNIRKELTAATGNYLRKRLSRRFNILGKEHGFEVFIDDEPVSIKDRDYYSKVEFLWCFGPGSEDTIQRCKNAKRHFTIDNMVNAAKDHTVRGWIGTVDEQKSIDDDNELNKIVIFANGKLVQEDILPAIKEGGVYTKYLVGDIDADFMDLNDHEDIVTSDRQSVKDDDPRYADLKEFIEKILTIIGNQWSKLRTEVGVARALENPIIKEWYGTLKGDQKRIAQQLFGKLGALRIDDPKTKAELYKSSLLAFEKLVYTHSLSTLEHIETEKDFQILARIFNSMDDVEAALYYQIVRGRLEVVNQFKDMLPDAKERLLQQHIFDHLWLLDPSWERASKDFRIEESVTTEFDKIDAGLSTDEKAGRIDIRYRTAAGKHIIIELKKYDRKVEVTELIKQLNKYRSALRKCLRAKYPGKRAAPIECICILGSAPEPQENEDENIGLLNQIQARYITYDVLIQQTQESYREYLEKQGEISRIVALLANLEGSMS